MTFQRKPTREPERIEFVREQRKQSNEFVDDVWQMVRGGRLLGKKFRRELPVGPYTLNFACIELKLDVEIDGKDHLTDEGMRRDAQRDAYMQNLGFTVLRIHGYRVTQDPMSVRNEIEAIVKLLALNPSPPTPLPRGGEGR